MNRRIRKCLFPVAGYGTRFLPITKSIAKEMLPIVDKPLLQYAIEEAMSAGITDMNIVSNAHKKSIEHYFTDNTPNTTLSSTAAKQLASVKHIIDSCAFNYCYQNEPKGLGHAVLCGQKLIENEAFAVILPDDLCINNNKSVLAQMLEIYHAYPQPVSIVAVEKVTDDEVSQYGMVEGEQIADKLYQVSNMIEKPAANETDSRLAIIGRYVLTADIFNCIEHTKSGKLGEIQITDALLTQAHKNAVIAYQFEGKRYDCGSIDGFISAANDCYLQRTAK